MAQMISLVPNDVPTSKLHTYLLGAVGPRPIAFASTVDADGKPNLAPFSFFNVFSANPPILIFSPARRVRDNTTKHTLENARATREVVINVVNYDMVQQMSLASTEYPKGENEFKKAGLTMLSSDRVTPYRVAESPVQMECKVIKIEALGKEGGAGNLIFCEVVRLHIHASIMDENDGIDQRKIDQVARMGGAWYTRAKEGMFAVPKPLSKLGIGVDSIPEHIRMSRILTGNDLGKLGNVERLPSSEEVRDFLEGRPDIRKTLGKEYEENRHRLAQEFLDQEDSMAAWKILLAK